MIYIDESIGASVYTRDIRAISTHLSNCVLYIAYTGVNVLPAYVSLLRSNILHKIREVAARARGDGFLGGWVDVFSRTM